MCALSRPNADCITYENEILRVLSYCRSSLQLLFFFFNLMEKVFLAQNRKWVRRWTSSHRWPEVSVSKNPHFSFRVMWILVHKGIQKNLTSCRLGEFISQIFLCIFWHKCWNLKNSVESNVSLIIHSGVMRLNWAVSHILVLHLLIWQKQIDTSPCASCV